MAMGLYTALPGMARWDDENRGRLAAMLPIAGLLLGAAWWGVSALAARVLPALLGAVAVALFMPVSTGLLHVDGFMDVSDALLSSRPREEKLRILKDPHAGAFAVVSVICLLLLMTGAADGILAQGRQRVALLFIPVISRALAGWAVMSLAPLPQSSYGRMNHETATQGRRVFCLAMAGAACLLSFLFGWRVGVACVAAAIGFSAACLYAVHSLDGMNGDCSGFAICCAEACGMIALACF